MVSSMKEVARVRPQHIARRAEPAQLEVELSVEERNLLSVAYKCGACASSTC